MKYMIEYSVRTAGLSHDQNFANQDALDAMSIGPFEEQLLREWVTNLDSRSLGVACR